MQTTSNILTSLPLVSKVIEKAVADPFTQHVQEHDLRDFAVCLQDMPFNRDCFDKSAKLHLMRN